MRLLQKPFKWVIFLQYIKKSGCLKMSFLAHEALSFVLNQIYFHHLNN
ncbi:TPA: hypothetical protein JAJ09_002751 [Clostridioides difficile]|nr:hypothetical protein [Clostridioides difficile]HAT6209962.1 hypothetical protein [Clostridioides difficile]HAT6261716.1 hypothetical protein [Clostridioides difficile]